MCHTREGKMVFVMATTNVFQVGCRVLHALMKYSLICTFMWMCLEGLHLYRLLVNAFAVPASLTGYYLTGFGRWRWSLCHLGGHLYGFGR